MLPRRRPLPSPAGLALVAVLLVLALATRAEANPRYASIVIDAATGAVLHERHADALRYPASLTKMMTLYMTFEALRDGRLELDQRLPVSAHAASMVPSKLGLRPGQSIRVDDAIQALITRSANDVAVVVAEALGGTERGFAELMTARARELGMSRTTFRNASGLPDSRQQSTARDMARLSMALLHDFPDQYDRFGARSFRYGDQVHRNHNRLLASYDGLDGIKTGYIRASGFNISASAVRGGRRLIAVVFGGRTARTRNDHAADLLDRAFARITPPRGHQIVGPPARKPDREVLLAEARAREIGPPEPKPEEPVIAAAEQETPSPRLLFDQGSAELDDVDAAKGFGIQVGAFSDPAVAERTLADVHRRFDDLLDAGRQNVVRVERDSRILYRARLIGLEEARASEVCRRLAEEGHPCHVITTDPGPIDFSADLPLVRGLY